jgi:anti-sigma B factor antagonist
VSRFSSSRARSPSARATWRCARRCSSCSSEGADKILIHLEKVTTIDSSGVGELVSAFTTVTNRGGKLKLVNLPPKVNDILQITQLITVFEVYDNEAEALASF